MTQLITALDVDTPDEAIDLIDRCEGCEWFKIGLQLFSRCGPSIVDQVKAKDKKVFLDLKLHDIPTTVAKAARAGAELGAELMTVHACGGRAMIAAAKDAAAGTGAKILAVTVLTSISDDVLRNEVGLRETAADAVVRYARQSVEAGAQGIVASPKEIVFIREAIGADPLVVTPGIRPAWAAANDQARIMTPGEAASAGANFIVVGRPITHHENPAEAVRLIREELQS
jgi:orotidine-5'-phosphate decarboxylase